MDYSLGKKLENLTELISQHQVEVGTKKDYDLAIDRMDEVKYILLGILKNYEKPE